MKNNKKGFTLIELLAVIVILAIIMVIAVPQILNVINNARTKAWESNAKLVNEAIMLNTTLGNTDFANWSLSTSCTSTDSGSPTVLTSNENFLKVVDISADDTIVTCYKEGSQYKVTVSAKADGQFDGQTAVTYTY